MDQQAGETDINAHKLHEPFSSNYSVPFAIPVFLRLSRNQYACSVYSRALPGCHCLNRHPRRQAHSVSTRACRLPHSYPSVKRAEELRRKAHYHAQP